MINISDLETQQMGTIPHGLLVQPSATSYLHKGNTLREHDHPPTTAEDTEAEETLPPHSAIPTSDHVIKVTPIPPPSSASKGTKAKRGKRSTSLTSHTPRSQLVEVWNAFAHAEHQGTPLNTFLSIDYPRHKLWVPHTRTVKERQDMEETVKQAVQHTLSDFCKRNGFSFSAVYGIENTPTGGHGLHIHLLMHLPRKRWADLQSKLKACLARSFKGTLAEYTQAEAEKDAATTDEAKKRIWLPFYITPSGINPNGALARNEAEVRLSYMCKSADPDEQVSYNGRAVTLATLVDEDQFKLQETGNARTRRRLGSTRNLGKKARNAAGWMDDQNLGCLSRQFRFEQLRERVLRLLERGFADSKIA